MEFVRAVARLPRGRGGPCFAGLQSGYKLLSSLVEMADFVVFNQNHGGGQGVEQHVEALVGLKQIGTEVFDFVA